MFSLLASKHWNGRRLGGEGVHGGLTPPPPTVYGRSNASLGGIPWWTPFALVYICHFPLLRVPSGGDRHCCRNARPQSAPRNGLDVDDCRCIRFPKWSTFLSGTRRHVPTESALLWITQYKR